MSEELVSTAETAALLGVRPETVYAYVSRGLLTRLPESSRHQGSRFRREEVLALRDRRRRPRAGVFEIVVETAISEVTPEGRLSYRGHDLAELLDGRSYQSVAELLWQADPLDWRPDGISGQAAALARGVPGASPASRVRLALASLGASRSAENGTVDPAAPVDAADLAAGLAAGVTVAGVRALNAAVDAVADAAPQAPSSADAAGAADVATRLAVGLGTTDRDLVNAALICLADHELATSTIAARVAAGARSGPYEVLLAGLAAIAGPRHGAACGPARRLLETVRSRGIRPALADWARHRPGSDPAAPPGFGHLVYRAPDPRAVLLLELLRERDPELVELVDRLSLEVLREHSHWPNVDLALAAVEIALGLAPGSGASVFGIARIAGFLAHAQEESVYPLRFRPRASYIGPSSQTGEAFGEAVFSRPEPAAGVADPDSASSAG